MEQPELAETVEALRAELAWAAEAGRGGVSVPGDGVQLEFHVEVTKAGEGKAWVRFYVVEPGGAGSYAREEIQTVTVTLGGTGGINMGSRSRSTAPPAGSPDQHGFLIAEPGTVGGIGEPGHRPARPYPQ